MSIKSHLLVHVLVVPGMQFQLQYLFCHRFGRSKMMLVSNISMVASLIAASYSVNLTMLIITRLVLGIFTAGVRNAAYANGMIHKIIQNSSGFQPF